MRLGSTRFFRVLIQSMILTMLALLVLNYSPFGSSDRADKYSQDLFNQFLGDWLYPDTHRDESLVLLLTDEVVETYQQGQWPARYDFHGRVLDTLLVDRPKAVFIDFIFLNKNKPGSAYLVKVLQRYAALNIPVYMAAVTPERLYSIWPELKGLVIPVSVDISFDSSDFVARHYNAEARNLTSAAFRIAKDLNIDVLNANLNRPMDIFWGTKNNPENSWINVLPGASDNLSDQLLEGFSNLNAHRPYSTTLFVKHLLNQRSTSEVQARVEAEKLIKNKIVFYGASLTGVQDQIFTPLRDILPGVYYHAMAFDNLLTWGEDYKSQDIMTPHYLPSMPRWLISFFVIFPVTVLLCVYHISSKKLQITNMQSESAKLNITHEKDDFFIGRDIINKGLLIITLLIWFLLCSWVEFSVFNLSVSSWIGYLEVISAGFIIEKIDAIEKVEGFFRRLFLKVKKHYRKVLMDEY